ncbi:MAG: hypothetical protein IKU72_02565 [Oscillospiraceae bacterium]|nr:hypothetical protein [Oscillospiraceae bacterium]
MRTEKTYPKYWLFLLLAAATAVLVLVLFTGPVRAHYEAAYSGDVTLHYNGNDNQIYLLSAERNEDGDLITSGSGYVSDEINWVAPQDEQGIIIPDTYSINFLLANTNNARILAAQQQTAKLALVATVGIADPEALVVVLDSGGTSYTGIPAEIKEGSSWYNEFGQGWVYRFYNAAGEELSWILRGGVFAYHEMNLTVVGSSQAAAALTLIATAETSD